MNALLTAAQAAALLPLIIATICLRRQDSPPADKAGCAWQDAEWTPVRG